MAGVEPNSIGRFFLKLLLRLMYMHIEKTNTFPAVTNALVRCSEYELRVWLIYYYV